MDRTFTAATMSWLSRCVTLHRGRDSWKHREAQVVESCCPLAPAAAPMILPIRVPQVSDASLQVRLNPLSFNPSIDGWNNNFFDFVMKETTDWINTLPSRHCTRFGCENTIASPRNWFAKCLDARIIFTSNRRDASSSQNSNTSPTTNIFQLF